MYHDPPRSRMPAPDAVAEPPDLTSEDIMAGCSCVRIHHEGKVYILRTTRQGKLLLTK